MERIVRVMEAGLQDTDRWIRVDRRPSGVCILEFHDLGLPLPDQKFFTITFDSYLLDLAVAGCFSRMCSEGSSCAITSNGQSILLEFRPAFWPFDVSWTVPRSDFVAAVVGLT
ncbi:hypothetical protein BH11ARM1_BH11ARM1_05280 [soil metagenome]